MAIHGKPNAEDPAATSGRSPAEGTAFEKLYPRLAWELTARYYGDGKTPREPSGFSIFQQDGLVKACLRDRNMGKVSFRSALTVHEVLMSFEEALQKGSVDWREDKYGRKG